jgi:hypothetical protein
LAAHDTAFSAYTEPSMAMGSLLFKPPRVYAPPYCAAVGTSSGFVVTRDATFTR